MDVMISMLATLVHNTNSGGRMKTKITGRSMKHKDSGFTQTAMLLHRKHLAAIESFALNVKKVIATNAIFSQTMRRKYIRISPLCMGDIIIEILIMNDYWKLYILHNIFEPPPPPPIQFWNNFCVCTSNLSNPRMFAWIKRTIFFLEI